MLPFLLASERIVSEPQPPRQPITVPTYNHEIERLKIEANCYANETSKSKQDFIIFTLNLTEAEKQAAKKLVE